MRTIEISEELWHYMEKYGNFGQPADSVLREALGITGDKPFPVASCRVKPIRLVMLPIVWSVGFT